MNITPSTIYWITRLDYFIGLAAVIIIICAIAFCIMLFAGLDDAREALGYTKEYAEKLRASGRRLLWWACLPLVAGLATFVATLFIPTTKEAAAMYVIPLIANNEKVQTVGNRLYDLAIEWMDEFKPTKKEEN